VSPSWTSAAGSRWAKRALWCVTSSTNVMGKGNKKILLNLAEVNYIDSSGIGVLVASFSTVHSQGGELKPVNPSKRIRDLLQKPLRPQGR
jgi:anti-anti-sigma factor